MTPEPEQTKYRRVPGLRWSGGRSVLRLADDHLLLCDYRTGFVERYKRFYFQDIQAIIIRKTMYQIAIIAVWGLFAFGFLIIGIATQWNLFLYIAEAICGLLILVQLMLGPTCRTDIKTAVQTDRIPALKRVRKTERIMRYLFPLIEEAQGKRGTLPADAAPVSQSPAPSSAAPPSTAVPPSVSVPVASANETPIRPRALSWVHLVTFIFAIFTGLLAIWDANFPSTASFTIFMIVFCLSAISGIAAIVRQTKRPVHGGAAAMIWLLVISYVAGGAWVNIGFSFADQVLRMTPSGGKGSQFGDVPFREIGPYQMRQMLGFEYVLWMIGIFSVLLGIVGLIFAMTPMRPRHQPPPLPNPQG